MVSEIEAIDHDCEELVESHVQTVHENVNSVIMGMEDAGTYVRSALEEGKLEMNCVKKQLEQNIEDIPACLSRSIAEVCTNYIYFHHRNFISQFVIFFIFFIY